MFSWLTGKKDEQAAAANGDGRKARAPVTEVGWVISADKATFIYDGPRPAGKKQPLPENVKAVGYCPAIVDHEARLFEVPCPVDLNLRIGQGKDGKPSLINAAGKASTVARSTLQSLVHLMGQDRWRHPKRPVLQISAPWRFISDDPVWMNQLPPFNHYRDPPLPGLMIGGRFPIHLWPRSLMWAFEWHDTSKDLILKRGEPWFYLRFETSDPARALRLVEAEMTEELKEYCSGLEGVVNFVKQSFDLFKVAEERRPKVLLKKVER